MGNEILGVFWRSGKARRSASGGTQAFMNDPVDNQYLATHQWANARQPTSGAGAPARAGARRRQGAAPLAEAAPESHNELARPDPSRADGPHAQDATQ